MISKTKLTSALVVSVAMFAAAVNAIDVQDDSSSATPMLNTALEFLARASSTSEVLTLNLTNLLILLVLKALIFGFGLFSVGGGIGGNVGRSAEVSEPFLTQADMTGGMCFLMYTSGVEEKFECLQRTSCEEPYLATKYLTAAKMWYKMHKYLKSVVPFNEKYARIMYGVKEASDFGKTGDDCSKKYSW